MPAFAILISLPAAEEKIDESEHQEEEEGSASASSASADYFSSQQRVVDVSGEASVRLGLLLRDLNDIISPPESEDEDEADNDDDDEDIANSNSSHQLPARKKKRQSTSPRSELLTQQFGNDGPYGFVGDNNDVEDYIESMCDDANQEGKKPYPAEEKEEQAPPPPPAFLSGGSLRPGPVRCGGDGHQRPSPGDLLGVAARQRAPAGQPREGADPTSAVARGQAGAGAAEAPADGGRVQLLRRLRRYQRWDCQDERRRSL